jgi:hypothetical protein
MTYDGPLEDMNSVQRRNRITRSALPPMADPIIPCWTCLLSGWRACSLLILILVLIEVTDSLDFSINHNSRSTYVGCADARVGSCLP